ncbi:hypothetical protein F4813DRAFT_350902 [Daldinia decipiens]|uniref:uncharacterized protein n=1 Tax=Daldinia decipiens TaxID=326647 RepID=UPI0020C2F960|nr:uncharacterized protein F4813DRAFT_350902 [Daldinia decipiens]KAI1660084.1 hypothetical protein F4813DRAFT_350902 [Daldinia decipiens]
MFLAYLQCFLRPWQSLPVCVRRMILLGYDLEFTAPSTRRLATCKQPTILMPEIASLNCIHTPAPQHRSQL